MQRYTTGRVTFRPCLGLFSSWQVVCHLFCFAKLWNKLLRYTCMMMHPAPMSKGVNYEPLRSSSYVSLLSTLPIWNLIDFSHSMLWMFHMCTQFTTTPHPLPFVQNLAFYYLNIYQSSALNKIWCLCVFWERQLFETLWYYLGPKSEI